MSCRLIINADDFGWSVGVNEAVLRLHQAGILTSASLMVGAPAAADAVGRLREAPSLAVGLHLALTHAPPVLPRAEVSRLVDAHGRLTDAYRRAGAQYTLLPAHRAQWQAEMAAQFEAFDKLGLRWSHVDSHLHLSLTPGVFRCALALCRKYRVVGFRVPQDDFSLYRQLEPGDAASKRIEALAFSVLCRGQRRRARSAGLRTTDRCYGFLRSGKLDADYLSRLVRALPDGDLELHCHPDLATLGGRAEYEALQSPSFRDALRERGVILSTYESLGPKS